MLKSKQFFEHDNILTIYTFFFLRNKVTMSVLKLFITRAAPSLRTPYLLSLLSAPN